VRAIPQAQRCILWTLLPLILLAAIAPAHAAQRPIRVLMTTGDWKNQPWYQDLWMRDKAGKPRIYRGRFIEKKVNEAAPGRFQFTHVPNYIAQQYLDADYLGQFDVLLVGDIMVHLSETFQTAVRDFVRNGGGLIYCANHKWGIGMKVKGQPFEDVLPTVWPDRDAKGDFRGWLDHRDFAPVVTAPGHPAIRGLGWDGAPPLGAAVNMPARKGATVLLATPRVEARPWQILGPFPNKDKAAFHTAYAPEKGVDLAKACTIPGIAKPVPWKRTHANAAGSVDLVSQFTPNEYVCAYAVAYVQSPDARQVLCKGQADDGMKVWVNGTLVPGDPAKDGAWPGQAPAALKPGWNQVLVKITQDPGGWSFHLDLLSADGKPLPDLAWSSVPADEPKTFIEPKPVLTAWQHGRGRAIFSASIFANDEQSEKLGQHWSDFGRYYAQAFSWLGANSKSRPAALKNAPAAVSVSVDFRKTLNAFPAGIFSIHGNEGILGQPVAMKHYMALNPQGVISRGGDGTSTEGDANDNDDPNVFAWERFDFKRVDAYLEECRQYGTEPIAVFHGLTYGGPKWLWPKGRWFGNANDREAAEVAEMVAAYLEHANHGHKGSPGYKLVAKYVDIGNEPELDYRCIEGYMRIVKAVGRRVHRDYPGVLVGAYCPYRMEYVKQFIDEVGTDFDWFSFHPYGWTPGEFFRFADQVQAYARAKGHRDLKLMITEWDFWIQGRQKFDYLMNRWFAAVQRRDLLGTIHYRLWQYVEPIYMFGILWAGWGPKDVVGEKGTPIHDAYDAFWIWRDFRGQRVACSKTLDTAGAPPRLLDHLHADASRTAGKLNALLYYDWAYGGTGYKDYARGLAYPKVAVSLKLALPASPAARTLTISRATGEKFEAVKTAIPIPAGRTEHTETIEIEPLTALSVTVR